MTADIAQFGIDNFGLNTQTIGDGNAADILQVGLGNIGVNAQDEGE